MIKVNMIPSYNYFIAYAQKFFDEGILLFDEVNLSGSRHSGKTKSILIFVCLMFIYASFHNKKITTYLFRKLNKDVPELSEEIANIFELWDKSNEINFVQGGGFKHKYTYKKKYNNNSKIEIRGVYTAQKDKKPLKGLSSTANSDLIIVYLEEADEFTQDEKEAIRFAVRGEQRTPYLFLTACNPESLFKPHIQYLNRRLAFNFEKLKRYHYQFGVVNEFGLTKVFHYGNWRNNPYVSETVMKALKELEKENPIKARVWSYGMIGNVEESVFSTYLPTSVNIEDFNFEYISGGVDLGASDSINAHPTACIITLWNNDKSRCHVYREYFQENRVGLKTRNIVMNEIVEFFNSVAKNFPYKTFTVYVDYGNGGNFGITLLNNLCIKKNITNFKFVPVDKSKLLLIPRVESMIILMTQKIISFDWKHLPNLYRTMDLMRYKIPSENSHNKIELIDLNDDCWDALMYSMMIWIDDAIQHTNLDLYYLKNKGF